MFAPLLVNVHHTSGLCYLRGVTFRLAIVGAPRSGTRYTATVLAASGLPTGHEASTVSPAGVLALPAIAAMVADVSWLLVPHIPELVRQGIAVALVSRHPLRVLPSMVARGFLDSRPAARRNQRRAWANAYALRHVPELGRVRQGDLLARAATFWLAWNRRALAASPAIAFRVEVLGINQVVALGALAGLELERRPAARTLGRTPRNVNAGAGPPLDALTWAELGAAVGDRLAGDVLDLAAALGHPLEVPPRRT